MTWRTILYLLVVLLAAVVVATTAISDSPEKINAVGSLQVPAQIDSPALPLPDQGSRFVLLVLGISAVVVTYRRAWTNFRPEV